MVRVFIPNDEIEKLGNLGASFSNEALQHHIGDFRAVIAKIRNELPVYQAKDRVSQEETFHAFQQLQKLLSIYSSFDIVYTDGMWKQVDTNPEAKKNIELIGRTKNEIRDMFNMPCFDTDGWLGTLLKKLSVQFAIPVPVLEWYRVKELEGLFDNQFLSDIELERRKLAYAFYIDSDKKHTLYSGADAERLSSEFESETPRDISLIQGTVAHGKGRKVTGTVRLIFRDYAHPEVTKSQMAAMHVGDILVSETTDPDLMEGLKKAGAIVTDSGGDALTRRNYCERT